ncbi:16S rRNA (guanine(527)-N(7))-methyltransferase RsmG [Desulfobacter hydrogenophilus]|uniref:Ribosomal RNA small subunit methyltransferase G n=1 Tax=Desulfobacter hydrogenophilus TaxID=2291 RepID=A0A328F6T0_9BACT|nr:16S rRNA (guanine(527)-N(7))-methyltransferase RsmG [Desulfobacter hydrogenophilus]NDY74208.1 16S rRNA (guanine(527)-N(7))-methyltransferase RsmG [Desulfobacter hydrogenophilus]QBH14460.1 16S rRNA (guanine(527)-N(7))-methyltransferase RsmG [Desulfobacter hydrogenophilus]RAM00218.1 16S rRNA (guanine(527)-N(7))-methyltransferase RsmG [Desulfobacter hydrogenophilus]
MNEFCHCLEKGADALGLSLSPDQTVLLAAHARQLQLWNAKMNLTAITDIQLVAYKHFVDALAAARFLDRSARIMDIGSGAGFPAVPMKVIRPDFDITMVDAVRKKVSFLNHVVRTLKLANIRALHARVEDLVKDPGHFQMYDAVTARGFADLGKLAALAGPMLVSGGRIYALKGAHALEEITPELATQFHITHKSYTLPFVDAQRFVVILEAL